MKKVYVLLLLYINAFFSFAQNQNPSLSCGVNDAVIPIEILEQMQNAPLMLKQRAAARIASNELYVCRMAIEIDSDTYEQFNRDTTFIKHEAYKQIERISKIFEKEINTQLVVTYVHIWKDSTKDPYKGSSDIFKLIDVLIDTWKNNNELKAFNSQYDKVMYMVSKGFTGAGGIAQLGGTSSVVPWGENGDSRGLMVAAHELGHNFGSPHTQNCGWVGGVIDYCYPSESGCYQKAIETIRGSIMSYCNALIPTFHPLCQMVMQSHAASNLQKILSIPIQPNLPTIFPFDKTSMFTWEPVLSADRYRVEISSVKDFSTLLFSDSTFINSYNFKSIKNNQKYYIRVKSINRFGESAWSNTGTLVIPDAILLPPTLTYPLNKAQNLVQGDNITLRFNPVSFAKTYEIEVTVAYDPYFKNPVQKQSVSKNEFTFKTPTSEELIWRVRAVRETDKSAWSETNTFWQRFPEGFGIRILNNGVNVPLTFPIEYIGNSIFAGATIKFTISLKEDFTDNVFTKTFLPTKFPSYTYICMAENLMPNTEYFVKVEESYNEEDGFEYVKNVSSGVLYQYTHRFNTGNSNISPQWTFFNNDKKPELARDIKKFHVGNNGIFIQNSQGVVRLDYDSLTVHNLDRNSTNGNVGNNIQALGKIADDNSFWVFNVISKIRNYNGAFPETVYALSQINEKTGEKISDLEITNPENTLIISVSIKNKLIFGYTGSTNTISSFEDGKITTIIKFDDKANSVTLLDWNDEYAWFEVYNLTQKVWELWRYDLKNKNYIVFNQKNTPSIGEYTYEGALDSKGNFWAILFKDGVKLGKFDGITWKLFDINNSVISRPERISIDKYDNVYVFDNSKIFKYDNVNWQFIGDYPLIDKFGSVSKMYVDYTGKIWFRNSSGLLRFNPCETVVKPEILADKTVMEAGENNLLVANGCSKVQWNWQSDGESNMNQLNTPTNILKISPEITTIYTAKCFDDGCLSTGINLNVSVLPTLTFGNINKNQVCQGDSIKLSPKIKGQFAGGNQFKMYLSANGVSEPVPFTLLNDDKDFLVVLSKSLPQGKYYLNIESSLPKVISKDSLVISVLEIPTITTKNISACEGDEISLVATTSNGKYVWNGPNNFNSLLQKPTISNVVTTNSGVYTVNITSLNGCRNTASMDVLVNPNPIIKTSINSSSSGESVLEGSEVQLVASSGGDYYLWNGPKNFSSNVQTPILKNVKIDDGGIYYVNVTDAKGCKTKSQIELKVELILSNQTEPTNQFKVFPNPATEIVRVQTDIEGYITYYIYDALGRQLNTQKFYKQITIPINELSRGVYYLQLQHKEQKSMTKIVIE